MFNHKLKAPYARLAKICASQLASHQLRTLRGNITESIVWKGKVWQKKKDKETVLAWFNT